MSQTFTVKRDWPFTAAEVYAAAVDVDYLQAKMAEFGGDGEPRVDDQGEVTVVRLPRRLPTESVPDPFRRLVGDGRVEQVEHWRQDAGSHRAEWTTEGQKLPGELRGSISVRSDGARSIYAVTGSVTVKVPFVGGAVERAVSEALVKLLSSELDFLHSWLEERRGVDR